jgi:hypothetical protein
MSITSVIKSIQDIMRKDAGVDGDAQLGWMLFLKIFDDQEQELELAFGNTPTGVGKTLTLTPASTMGVSLRQKDCMERPLPAGPVHQNYLGHPQKHPCSRDHQPLHPWRRTPMIDTVTL